MPATPDTCLDPNLNVDFFNTPAVQAAMHVTAANQSHWVQCSSEVGGRSYGRTALNLLPSYPALIAAYRVLIYRSVATPPPAAQLTEISTAHRTLPSH